MTVMTNEDPADPSVYEPTPASHIQQNRRALTSSHNDETHMDHITQQERANHTACMECAKATGYTEAEAEACEAGELRCIACPFVPRYACKAGGVLAHPDRKCPQAIQAAGTVECTYRHECPHKSTA